MNYLKDKVSIRYYHIDQLGRIRLSRDKLEKWIHAPFLKRAVGGCFIRIGIRSHNARCVYRIAEVVDVCKTGKVYDELRTPTVLLCHGAQERAFSA